MELPIASAEYSLIYGWGIPEFRVRAEAAPAALLTCGAWLHHRHRYIGKTAGVCLCFSGRSILVTCVHKGVTVLL
ncbi:MAG: hypothetical protein VXX10_07480, partial [Pseudomonadota bacterium]|nr:hypothetical protein [Pseudomonadota bacterium]